MIFSSIELRNGVNYPHWSRFAFFYSVQSQCRRPKNNTEENIEPVQSFPFMLSWFHQSFRELSYRFSVILFVIHTRLLEEGEWFLDLRERGFFHSIVLKRLINYRIVILRNLNESSSDRRWKCFLNRNCVCVWRQEEESETDDGASATATTVSRESLRVLFFWRTYQTIIKLSLLSDVCFVSSAISTLPHMSGTFTSIVSKHMFRWLCYLLNDDLRISFGKVNKILCYYVILGRSRCLADIFGEKQKYLSVKRVYCRGCVRWTDAR